MEPNQGSPLPPPSPANGTGQEPQAIPGASQHLEFPLSGQQFWVIGGDGRRYGPSDREGLLRWCEDGRIAPDMMVVDNLNGSCLASRFFEFSKPDPDPMPFHVPSPPTPPPMLDEFETGFDRHFQLGAGSDKRNQEGYPEYQASYSLSILALLMGLVVPPVALLLQPFAFRWALRAKQRGIAEADLPIGISVVSFGISLILFLIVVLVLIA